jgi:hypothetical protein
MGEHVLRVHARTVGAHLVQGSGKSGFAHARNLTNEPTGPRPEEPNPMTSAPTIDDLPEAATRILAEQPPNPAEIRYVRAEPAVLPAKPPDRWLTGVALRGAMLAYQGRDNLPAAGAVDPDSVVVRTRADGRLLHADRDYVLDRTWACLGRTPDMPDPGPVAIDYRFSLRRIDSLVHVDPHDPTSVVLLPGHSTLVAPQPPAVPTGARLVANLLIPAFSDGSDYELFVPAESPMPAAVGLDRLPRSAERLRTGGSLRITCWGDSITDGGESSSAFTRYPAVLERRLQAAYPQAEVTVTAVAVGGSSTRDWLTDAAGSGPAGCNWQRVVDSRPDLVTLEFVNDAGLDPVSWPGLYAQVRERVQALGAELLVSTPILTMPAWLGREHCHGGDDRPYTAFVRADAERHGVAVADISAHWQHVAVEGIPYISLLSNGINHPDDRGHALMARVFAGALGAAD